MQYNRIPTRSRTALALTSCAVAVAACGGLVLLYVSKATY